MLTSDSKQDKKKKAETLQRKTATLEDLSLFVMRLFPRHLLRARLNLRGLVFTY